MSLIIQTQTKLSSTPTLSPEPSLNSLPLELEKSATVRFPKFLHNLSHLFLLLLLLLLLLSSCLQRFPNRLSSFTRSHTPSYSVSPARKVEHDQFASDQVALCDSVQARNLQAAPQLQILDDIASSAASSGEGEMLSLSDNAPTVREKLSRLGWRSFMVFPGFLFF